MERTLILHIGNHKTGTSSIQRSLFLEKKTLHSHGFSLFHERMSRLKTRGNTSCWIETTPDNICRSAVIRKGLAKRLAGTEQNVIMSAESFSWIFDVDVLRTFYQELRKYFDRITVICYLRRQDKQAISPSCIQH